MARFCLKHQIANKLLLERLKIPFSLPNIEKEERKAKAISADDMPKNFDVEKLEALFNELQEMKAFSQIKDPITWQRQIRDEWN